MLSRLATALLLVAVAFVGSAQAGRPTYILPWTVCCKIVDGKSVKQVCVLRVRVTQCPNDGTIDNPLMSVPMQVSTIGSVQGTADNNYAYLDDFTKEMINAWTEIVDIKDVSEIDRKTGLIVRKVCEKQTGWKAKPNAKCFKVALVRVKCQSAESLCKILKDKAVISGLKKSLDFVCEWVSAADLLAECSDPSVLTADEVNKLNAQMMDNQLPLGATTCDLTSIPFINESIRKLRSVHETGQCNIVDKLCAFKNEEDKADFLVALIEHLRKVKVQDLQFESTISTCKEGNVRMKFDGKVCLCRELILCCKKWKLAWATPEDKAIFDKIINCISGCNDKCTITQNIRNALTVVPPATEPVLELTFPGTTNNEEPTDEMNLYGEDVVITATCGDEVLVANFTLTCVECLNPKK